MVEACSPDGVLQDMSLCMRCPECNTTRENLLAMVEACSPDGVLQDMSLCMRCPECNTTRENLRPSLRGGDWFIHDPYLPTQERLLSWLDECVQKKLRVAVLEVGVGPNTPVVTRIPAAAFA